MALWLARFYPDRVGKIYTLGTKLNWNEVEVEKEIKKQETDGKVCEQIGEYIRQK